MLNAPVTFKEAEAMIAGRMDFATSAKYEDIIAGFAPDARQRAFFSARVADATILSELHRTVRRVVSGEMTKKQAVRILRERFAGPDADALGVMGFAPKRDAQGISELASIPRLKLIMDTNIRMAQECGHYQQWEKVKDFYPFGIWHCGYAEEHRPEHLERNGRLYPFGHPIWRDSPPGGEFNCHCWRENVTKAAAEAKGLIPEDVASEFVPSSLGFDPSRPLDGDTVQPGKRVLPSLAEKAKAQPCPDDVLPDMKAEEEERRKAEEEAKRLAEEEAKRLAEEEAKRLAEEEARRHAAIENAVIERRKEMAQSISETAGSLAKSKPDKQDFEYKVNRIFDEELKKRDYNVSIAEYKTIKNYARNVVNQEHIAECKKASIVLNDMVPRLYTEEALKYGRPPKVVWAPDCERTALSPDGFELLIGKDIAGHPENIKDILNGLDFAEQMKKAQQYRREFAQRQLKAAKILDIDVRDITFINDIETRERLRNESIMDVNPNFSTGLYEWKNNCQRCVVASEARRIGLPVVARPVPAGYDKWSHNPHWADFFDDGAHNIIPCHGRTMTNARGLLELNALSAGEGARFTVKVYWKGGNSHVFRAEVRHGKVIYSDPQPGTMDCSDYWKKAIPQSIDILRVDNLDFCDTLNQAAKKRSI